MKTLAEITAIIIALSDAQFDAINDAEYDSFSLDKTTARNGRRRFLANLRKAGLTEAEWDAWDAE